MLFIYLSHPFSIVLERLWDEIKCNMRIIHGRDYFAGLRVTKRNKATVLLTLTLLQTPTLTLTRILTLT
jgi:hypothetical protein